MSTTSSTKRKLFNVRLKEETIKSLDEICKRQSLKRGEVISVLLHAYSTGSSVDEIDEFFELVRKS